MADPADLVKAWQHAIRDLGGLGASLASGPAGAASDLVRPLQHQAELLQHVLQRQLEFERELVGRAAAPLHAAGARRSGDGELPRASDLVSGGIEDLRPARHAHGSAGIPSGTRRRANARPANRVPIR